jgi:putative transposase
MARLPRLDVPGVAQHVIQRGNNRQVCFGSEEDFVAYAGWLHEYAVKHEVAIHALN